MIKTMVHKIVSLLKKRREGMSFQKIVRELHFSPRDKHQLKRALQKLENQGIVLRIKRKYFVPVRSNLLRGKFAASAKGYGFVTPDKGLKEDIFIPAAHSAGALDGDLVEILYRKWGKKGKPEGRVVRILKKGKKRIIGLFREHWGKPYFLPLEAPFSQEFPLIITKNFTPITGMIVEAERETKRLTDILGMPDESGVDTEAVIRRYNIISSFSQKALEEARSIPSEIPAQEKKVRMDYRSWVTVTIDGETAQDFDDAVSVKKLGNGRFLLGVHIADVSHYVQPDSSLDEEAYKRGTSVYFPDRTLPMLPEKLSNNICSLRPKEERLTFSVILEIDRGGNVLKRTFHPSLIQTKARMTYRSVYKIFEGDEEERRKFCELVPDLMLMKELACILNRKRKGEGSLDFDLTEPELVYKERTLISVLPFERNKAHQVIEEFMVAANETVATYLSGRNIPLIYRIHPKPREDDLKKLREMLALFCIYLPQERRIKSEDLQQALNQAEGKPWEKFIDLQVLKSLQLALYSEENRGHYGLAKKAYTHFTSPIRRYPDLVVHRILRKVLRGEELKSQSLSSMALNCSQQARRAEKAERELLEWRIYRFLKQKLGEEVEGTIVDISKAGLVVELDNYCVDVVVFFTDLGGDYYIKKSEKSLIGRRTGRRFELGDRVKGILVSVDPILRRINMTLTSEKKEERQ